ncbi:hypothetical protein Syun_023899 [Stephania yunnanensis]|uniref:Cytochrome P450 n=1 Tax=Stephania yunnanensis TaxID=152371 RepID=A0AAP0FPC5_9MAGN
MGRFLVLFIHEDLFHLAKSYGPLFSLRMGQRPAIVVSSPEITEEILKHQDATFSSRTITEAVRTVTYGATSLVFVPYGSRWRLLRKVLSTELFSSGSLSALLHSRFKQRFELYIAKLSFRENQKKVRKLTKSSSFNNKVVVNKNYAPEPPGAWPIIGHLPLLVSAKQPHRAFAALAEKYGPAFMLRMGMSSPMLIRLLKNVTLAKDHVFATRPVTTAGKLMAYDHSVMGFTPFGTYWREIRKIATVELFSARRIGMLKPVRQSEVSLWMKGLHEKWVHNGNSSVSVELKTQLEELTFNLLTQMVAGKRYYGSNVAKADEKMARLFRHAVQQFNYHLGNSEMYDALPFMAWLDFKGDAKAMKNTQKDLDYIM